MGREATEPDAEQQLLLLRRCHRLFSAEERSFRIDRRSRAATALRAVVGDVLPRFLGSYTDDTLAEYIVVLICNGKHQYQARDDLEAFLGDDSAKFVAWLWSYLSKQAVASADNCNFQHGMDNENENLNDKKNLLVAKVQRGSHIVNSKISASETYDGLLKLDSNTGRNVPQRCINSTVISSPERLGCDRCILDNQHHKQNGQNATCSRSFSERTAYILTEEKLHHGKHLERNASTRCLPQAVEIDDGRMPECLKRRRNVWDRLGKPVLEDHGLIRGRPDIPVQNRVHKMAKLMVVEHEPIYRVTSNAEHNAFDKADSQKFTNSYTDVNTVQGHEHVRKANRSSLIGRLSFGEGSVFHGDAGYNNLQDSDVIIQKSTLSLPIKSIQSSLNEFTSDMKGSPAAVSEPTYNITTPSKGHVLASKKLTPVAIRRNPETEVSHGEQVGCPAQSKIPSSVREDCKSSRNKPVKEEILDVRIRLKQMEQDVLKLRSKQAQITNGKQGALSLGPHASLEEDACSRTVVVINVHFAATKEALSMHFMKCGTVLKVNILTDITGHPKGAAYITFAERQSIEKAISLSGTSFLTRVITVMRKADAPPVFLASVQKAGRRLQQWKSPPFQKVSTPGYHLQWKRDQSVLEKIPCQLRH